MDDKARMTGGGGGQQEMTRRSDKLNSLLQVGAIYTGTVSVAERERAKLPGRSFIKGS